MLTILATLLPLALSSPLPSSFLPSSCSSFTVGSCSPDMDELVDSYTDIPSAALCQQICGIQEGCNYFSHSSSSLLCSLYHYRFLSSCQLVAGPSTPPLDQCITSVPEETPSCSSFMRENCTFLGSPVLNKTSITDGHACQALLDTLGWLYSATYFSFDSDQGRCVFYSSQQVDCQAVSGPVRPAIQDCQGNITTAAAVTTEEVDTNDTWLQNNVGSHTLI